VENKENDTLERMKRHGIDYYEPGVIVARDDVDGYERAVDGVSYRIERHRNYSRSLNGKTEYYIYKMTLLDTHSTPQFELLAVLNKPRAYDYLLDEWLLLECYQYCKNSDGFRNVPERMRKLIPRIQLQARRLEELSKQQATIKEKEEYIKINKKIVK
jgi:hypothetical protein